MVRLLLSSAGQLLSSTTWILLLSAHAGTTWWVEPNGEVSGVMATHERESEPIKKMLITPVLKGLGVNQKYIWLPGRKALLSRQYNSQIKGLESISIYAAPRPGGTQ